MSLPECVLLALWAFWCGALACRIVDRAEPMWLLVFVPLWPITFLPLGVGAFVKRRLAERRHRRVFEQILRERERDRLRGPRSRRRIAKRRERARRKINRRFR